LEPNVVEFGTQLEQIESRIWSNLEKFLNYGLGKLLSDKKEVEK
jgi:hypothetical protein